MLQPKDPANEDNLSYWKARANGLEGIRRDEAARHQAKVAALETQVRALTVKNSELVRAAPAAQPTINLADHFSPEEIESFGPERAAVIQRNIQKGMSTVEAEVATLRAELAALKQTGAKSAEDLAAEAKTRFESDLTELVPAWREIDKDPRWRQKWLLEKDASNGMVRDTMLSTHVRARNAEGVALLLKQFMASLNPAPPPPAVPPLVPPALDGNGGDAPPRPVAGGGDGVMLTEQQIKDGYKRKATGKMAPDEERLFDARVAAQMQRAGRA